MKNKETDSSSPKTNLNTDNISDKDKDAAAKKGFPGYPHYPASEDIFNNEEEVDVDPDKIPDNKKGDV